MQDDNERVYKTVTLNIADAKGETLDLNYSVTLSSSQEIMWLASPF